MGLSTGAGGLNHFQGFGDDLRADAVSRNDRNALLLGHGWKIINSVGACHALCVTRYLHRKFLTAKDAKDPQRAQRDVFSVSRPVPTTSAIIKIGSDELDRTT